MRNRVPRPPAQALAAVATTALLSLAMTGTAGATGLTPKLFQPSGGPPIPTSTSCTGFTPLPAQGCAKAGYQASGRNFRYAQAVITVPDHNGVVSACPPGAGCVGAARPSAVRRGAIRDAPPSPGEADPQIYVALDDSSNGSSQFARAGVQPCTGGAPCGSSGWRGVRPGHGGSRAGLVAVHIPITAADEGDGVFVSVYLDPAGQSVHTVITLPDGSTFNNTFPDRGAVYPRAQAVADWTTAVIKPQPVVPSRTRSATASSWKAGSPR